MARPPSKRAVRTAFEEANRRFFGGVLPPIDLEVVDIPWHGAFFPPDEEHPFGLIVLAKRGLPAGGWRGILTHELVHAYLWFMHPELDEYGAEAVAYHGPVFTEECNRIGRDLGLPEVHEHDCWAWPWSVEEEEDPEAVEDD